MVDNEGARQSTSDDWPFLYVSGRLIPDLTDVNLSGLAWHIRGITALAIAFVVVVALIRLGGVL
ncbi:MAG: hypothetical protein EBV00_06210 [Burkholderiaceae bacterium]|nr:hypothetical protein [Burkholderiaceae bacterium]